MIAQIPIVWELQFLSIIPDYSKGFGGKYGVQTDRKDETAGSYDDMQGVSSTYQKTRASSGMLACEIKYVLQLLIVEG